MTEFRSRQGKNILFQSYLFFIFLAPTTHSDACFTAADKPKTGVNNASVSAEQFLVLPETDWLLVVVGTCSLLSEHFFNNGLHEILLC
jgi:hypothetical protein